MTCQIEQLWLKHQPVTVLGLAKDMSKHLRDFLQGWETGWVVALLREAVVDAQP